jgi:hypothetical protein
MRYGRVAGVAAGLAVVALLVLGLGLERIGAHLKLIGGGFAWVLVAYLASNVVYALPFALVLPRDTRPKLGALIVSRLAAVSVNAATPFLGVGGEPVRLLWLPPPARKPGVAALVVDRSAFLGASALFLAAGSVVAATRLHLPPAGLWALVGLALLALGLAAVLYRLQSAGGGVTAPLARIAGWFARHRAQRLAEEAREIDSRIRLLHTHEPGRFAAAIGLHLAGRLFTIAEVLVASHLLGFHLGAGGALIFASVPLAVDLAFSMIPSQIGVHEGSAALLAVALGLDPAAGVALAFVQRLRQVVFVSLGFALLATRRQAAALSETNSNPSAR